MKQYFTTCTYAGIRLHDIFVLHDGHHVGLGKQWHEFLLCLGRESCNTTSLSLTNHCSDHCVLSGSMVKILSIMVIEGLSRNVSWELSTWARIYKKKFWHGTLFIRVLWGVPCRIFVVPAVHTWARHWNLVVQDKAVSKSESICVVWSLALKIFFFQML